MAQSRSIVRPAGDPLVGTSPTDTRLALAALLDRAAAAAFGVRPGVLWGGAVSGAADWSYNVAPAALVMARGGDGEGSYLAAITGVLNVPTDPAPGTGSRIDIVYALQNDPDLGDADNEPVLDVAIGTASGSPVAPTLPTGALELGRATITSSMSQTLDATVASTAPFTRLHGAMYELPNQAALTRVADPRVNDRALLVATSDIAVYSGSSWRSEKLPDPVTTYVAASQDITSTTAAALGTPVEASLQITHPMWVDVMLTATFGTGTSAASTVYGVQLRLSGSGAGVTLTPDSNVRCLSGMTSPLNAPGTVIRTVKATSAGTLEVEVFGALLNASASPASVRGVELTLKPRAWA